MLPFCLGKFVTDVILFWAGVLHRTLRPSVISKTGIQEWDAFWSFDFLKIRSHVSTVTRRSSLTWSAKNFNSLVGLPSLMMQSISGNYKESFPLLSRKSGHWMQRRWHAVMSQPKQFWKYVWMTNWTNLDCTFPRRQLNHQQFWEIKKNGESLSESESSRFCNLDTRGRSEI